MSGIQPYEGPNEIVERLRAELAAAKAELAAERATSASLLRTIALIREAGGFTREDLDALPGAVKAMRQQRDEANSLIRAWKVNIFDFVDNGEIMYAITSDSRCSMNDAHKRAFLAAMAKEGGGAC